MYLTYEEYKNFGGDITLEDFNFKSIKAQRLIDNYTSEALKGAETIPNEVKACMVDVISLLDKTSQNDYVSSEKVGNWSVNYKDVDFPLKLDEIFKLYLDNLEINGKRIINRIAFYV